MNVGLVGGEFGEGVFEEGVFGEEGEEPEKGGREEGEKRNK